MRTENTRYQKDSYIDRQVHSMNKYLTSTSRPIAGEKVKKAFRESTRMIQGYKLGL